MIRDSKYGSRKFILAILVTLVSTYMAKEHVLDSADYKAILIAVLGLYGLSNLGSAYVAKSKPTVTTDVSTTS